MRGRHVLFTCLIVLLFSFGGCAGSARSGGGGTQQGIASYYADRYDGRTTANGEIFDVSAMTAAHRTLPFGTRVRVTNLQNGRTVVVRINDRGPYVDGRIIDLSPAAARQIDMIRAGIVPVKVAVVGGTQVARIQ